MTATINPGNGEHAPTDQPDNAEAIDRLQDMHAVEISAAGSSAGQGDSSESGGSAEKTLPKSPEEVDAAYAQALIDRFHALPLDVQTGKLRRGGKGLLPTKAPSTLEDIAARFSKLASEKPVYGTVELAKEVEAVQQTVKQEVALRSQLPDDPVKRNEARAAAAREEIARAERAAAHQAEIREEMERSGVSSPIMAERNLTQRKRGGEVASSSDRRAESTADTATSDTVIEKSEKELPEIAKILINGGKIPTAATATPPAERSTTPPVVEETEEEEVARRLEQASTNAKAAIPVDFSRYDLANVAPATTSATKASTQAQTGDGVPLQKQAKDASDAEAPNVPSIDAGSDGNGNGNDNTPSAPELPDDQPEPSRGTRIPVHLRERAEKARKEAVVNQVLKEGEYGITTHDSYSLQGGKTARVIGLEPGENDIFEVEITDKDGAPSTQYVHGIILRGQLEDHRVRENMDAELDAGSGASEAESATSELANASDNPDDDFDTWKGLFAEGSDTTADNSSAAPAGSEAALTSPDNDNPVDQLPIANLEGPLAQTELAAGQVIRLANGQLMELIETDQVIGDKVLEFKVRITDANGAGGFTVFRTPQEIFDAQQPTKPLTPPTSTQPADFANTTSDYETSRADRLDKARGRVNLWLGRDGMDPDVVPLTPLAAGNDATLTILDTTPEGDYIVIHTPVNGETAEAIVSADVLKQLLRKQPVEPNAAPRDSDEQVPNRFNRFRQSFSEAFKTRYRLRQLLDAKAEYDFDPVSSPLRTHLTGPRVEAAQKAYNVARNRLVGGLTLVGALAGGATTEAFSTSGAVSKVVGAIIGGSALGGMGIGYTTHQLRTAVRARMATEITMGTARAVSGFSNIVGTTRDMLRERGYIQDENNRPTEKGKRAMLIGAGVTLLTVTVGALVANKLGVIHIGGGKGSNADLPNGGGKNTGSGTTEQVPTTGGSGRNTSTTLAEQTPTTSGTGSTSTTTTVAEATPPVPAPNGNVQRYTEGVNAMTETLGRKPTQGEVNKAIRDIAEMRQNYRGGTDLFDENFRRMAEEAAKKKAA